MAELFQIAPAGLLLDPLEIVDRFAQRMDEGAIHVGGQAVAQPVGQAGDIADQLAHRAAIAHVGDQGLDETGSVPMARLSPPGARSAWARHWPRISSAAMSRGRLPLAPSRDSVTRTSRAAASSRSR